MPRDLNLVVMSGTVISDPVMVPLKNSKFKLCFDFRVVENFNHGDGTPATRPNIFPVEILGRNIDRYQDELRPDQRYMITGYLRKDVYEDGTKTCIRCYNVQPAD